MKQLNISKYKSITGVKNNIDKIHKSYGSIFNIVYKKKTFPVKYFYKKNIGNDKIDYLEFYEKKRHTFIKPFLLQFYSQKDDLNKNNCYIVNIHKTNEITGTEMMDFVLYFLKKLDVKKVFIFDDTKVECNDRTMDLSLQKLLTKNKSFYQRFGFKYYLSDSDDPIKLKIIGKHNIINCLNNKLKEFKNIYIRDILHFYIGSFDLINSVIKNNDYSKLEIGYYDSNYNEIIYNDIKNNKKEVDRIIRNYLVLLPILLNNKNKKLYLLLKDFFFNECEKYLIVSDNIFYDKFYSISYKNLKYHKYNKKLFDILIYIRQLGLYKNL